MTPKMLRALSAAHAAEHTGGLHYTVGGWIVADQCWEYHNFGSVTALIDRGYLQQWGKGRQRYLTITDLGRAALEDEREKLTGSPS